MVFVPLRIWLPLSIIAAFTLTAWLPTASSQDVDFTRQVRPILSNRCFACHGPDQEKQQGGLRLDEAASAYATLPSEHTAVVPGKPDGS